MNESIKRRFLNWLKTIDANTLIDTEKILLNIINNNIDMLVPLGTAGGLRGKKLAELIQQQRDTASTNLPKLDFDGDSKKESVEKIVEFAVGPFRGFSSNEIFNLDNNYVFIYGPNGSGKSSFCEGLEYALLGDIWEANAKRIAIEQYIQNSVTKKSETPIARYKTKGGDKTVIQKNPDIYQFAFIEKNRIDEFARITAVPPSEQKDRIAILFGLDEFNNFVDNFTDDFQKYLSANTPIKDDFILKSQEYEQKKNRLLEIEKELSNNSSELTELIENVNNNTITDKDSLKLFLAGNDGNSGIINQLQIQKVTAIPSDIDFEIINNYKTSITSLQKSITQLENDMTKFYYLSSDLKFSNLYNAITVIENDNTSDKTICPACKTPISKTVTNPFDNAKSELIKLKELSTLQENIPINARDISQQARNIKQNAIQITDILTNINCSLEFSSISEVDYISIDTISSWQNILFNEIDTITKEFNKYDELIIKCKEYNKNLSVQREQKHNIDDEIQKYNNYYEKLIQITTIEDKLHIEKQNIKDTLKQFEELNKEKLEEIKSEQETVEKNKKYIEAYNRVIKLLKKYRDALPALFSAGLADKTMEYYNVINSHDPEFDRIENLILPTKNNEKLTVRFSGSSEDYDALYIFSEGHIKILGLSILLAKVVTEDLKIIIFDDIVNAIDDDHKGGIVDLLIGHPDMANRQIILTCHGEQFINKLEHKMGSSRAGKEIERFRFSPMESSPIRKIIIDSGDTKHYLLQAEEAIKRDDRKEAAFKCRQATESISQSLWKKLGNKLNINLSVKMRTPTSDPDLSSVVDALIKEIENIGKDSNLYKSLKELKEKYNWNLLNKGTHEQEDLPEFDRDDILKLITLTKNIEEQIIDFKIKTTLEDKGRPEQEQKQDEQIIPSTTDTVKANFNETKHKKAIRKGGVNGQHNKEYPKQLLLF